MAVEALLGISVMLADAEVLLNVQGLENSVVDMFASAIAVDSVNGVLMNTDVVLASGTMADSVSFATSEAINKVDWVMKAVAR